MSETAIEVFNILVNYGLAGIIVGYFLYKDYKLNDRILSLMGEVTALMRRIDDTMEE